MVDYYAILSRAIDASEATIGAGVVISMIAPGAHWRARCLLGAPSQRRPK